MADPKLAGDPADDRLQVWEINTNPRVIASTDSDVLASTDLVDVERKAHLSQYAELVNAAFVEIDVQDGR